MKTKSSPIAFLGTVLILIPTWLLLSQGADRSGPLLLLYSEPNFEGRVLEVTDTMFDLPVEYDANGKEIWNWNDEVRSVVVVRGTFRLFQHGRCNTELDDTPIEDLDVQAQSPVTGWSSLVSATSHGPVRIPRTASGGFHLDVSSIALVSRENLPEWAVFVR